MNVFIVMWSNIKQESGDKRAVTSAEEVKGRRTNVLRYGAVVAYMSLYGPAGLIGLIAAFVAMQ